MNQRHSIQKEKQKEKEIQSYKNINMAINGYELRIQLLQKQLISKNKKILQITTNRKEMLKQQISSYFESIEQYLNLIVLNTQDKNFPQYVKKFLQFTKSLRYKKSWFIEQKCTINNAVQTQLGQQVLNNKQFINLSFEKNQKIASAFELTNFDNQQQFNSPVQNFKSNQKNRSKTLPYLSQQIDNIRNNENNENNDKISLQKQQIENQQFRKKTQMEDLLQKMMIQNQELKQLLKKAWLQINTLSSKNLLIQNQQNNLKTTRGQENFKTHRVKFSQGNIKYMKQIQKNSELISSDIYNLSQTPLLSKQNNYQRIGKQIINHHQITKHLFDRRDITESNIKQNYDLHMMLLCQANSIQKLLSCIK